MLGWGRNEIMTIASKDEFVGDSRVEWRKVSGRPKERLFNHLVMR